MRTDDSAALRQQHIERSLAEHPTRLSNRERQCLTLAARGMTSADIGLKLDISARTVSFHLSNVIQKLGALNRYEAISLALSSA